jgi:hypothetical protein
VARRRLVVALVGVVFAATVLLAITFAAFRQEGNGEDVASIDEVRGTYHGVGIGDDAVAVRRVFGERHFARPDKEPYIPTSAHLGRTGGPAVLSPPCKPTRQVRGGRTRLALLRYEKVSFLLCDGSVFAVMVIGSDARTLRGLSVGDDLDRAGMLYASLTCAEARSGDIDHYPYCAGPLSSPRGSSPLHVWFGEDPVASITLSTTRYDGYEK